jgi:DNA-binding NarL/FixJ family response regulator
MPVASDLQVFGIQEALKEINDFDKKYRRQITTDLQQGAGAEIVRQTRSFIPTDYPLEGMARGAMIKGRNDTTFSIGRVSAGVKTLVAKRASKERTVTFTRPLYIDGRVIPNAYTQDVDFKARPFALLTAQQKDAAGALWDHAGVNERSQFVQNLITYGKQYVPEAPRALAQGVGEAMPTVEVEVSKVLDRVSEKLNKNLRLEKTR